MSSSQTRWNWRESRAACDVIEANPIVDVRVAESSFPSRESDAVDAQYFRELNLCLFGVFA